MKEAAPYDRTTIMALIYENITTSGLESPEEKK
jgi:hypothetical protein